MRDHATRIPMSRRRATRCLVLLAVLAAALMPVAGQGKAKKPEPETKPGRVVVPAKPHAAPLAAALAALQQRNWLDLSFQDAALGEVARTISETSTVDVSVSKKVSQQKVTLELRGEITLVELFDRLCREIDGHVVVERSGMVRVLSAGEYERLAEASGGSLGAPVRLPGYYPQLEFRMLAYPEKGELDVDLEAEKKRLQAWLEKEDNRRRLLRDPGHIARFLGLSSDRGGRLSKDIRWFPHKLTTGDGRRFTYSNSRGPHAQATLAVFSDARWSAGPRNRDDYLVELLAVNVKERGFTTRDLVPENVRGSKDTVGRPALLYEMKPEPGKAFSDLTARNIRRGMAMILDGYVISAPVVMTRVPRRGQITGLSAAEVERILGALDR